MPDCRKALAFSLIEPLVSIAVVGILAALLLSALAAAKRRGPRVVCLNSLKKIQAAWAMYAHDHEDKLAENSDQPQAGRMVGYESWVAGWLRSEFEPGTRRMRPTRICSLARVTRHSVPWGDTCRMLNFTNVRRIAAGSASAGVRRSGRARFP